jgi:hypothetical protein
MMKRPNQVKNAPDQGLGERVPPGQFVSRKLPVLTYGTRPRIDLASWRLRVFGLVEREVELDWEGELVWEWEPADPASTLVLGDVDRLEDGRTLTAWGLDRRVIGLDAESEEVWRVEIEEGFVVGQPESRGSRYGD